MAADDLNPPLGTTTPEVFFDNVKRADRLVNGPAATVDDRGGKPLDTWRQMMAKNDEIRQNIIPLSRQYMTLEAAQADIANIPPGSTTYVRSPDGSALAIEYMNVDGTLQPTGRAMASKEYIDEIKSYIPLLNRTQYWGGVIAADKTIGVAFRISDNRPIFGNGGDIVGRIEKLEQINPIVTEIAHAWGNSKTAGTGGTPYPTQLAELIGDDFTAINYGIGGQKSGQIAMRMGAVQTFLTLNGDAIPAANGVVTITQINGVSATAAPTYPSQDVRLLSTTADNVTRTIDGWLCGVKCRITRTASGDNNNTKVEVYTLTALTGSGVRCLPGSLFVPDYAMQDYSNVEAWIDAGINDFRSGTDADLTDDVEAIRRNVDAMVDFAERNKRPIILLSLTADNYSTELRGGIRYEKILELNYYWSKKYPNYYARGNNGLDLRETLVANYNPANSQDVIDYGNDITPSSLRSDDRHPNTTGYGIYASVAYEFRERRGY